VARDTKARHACGIPAPSYNQLKGLHDVRHYSDAEQALILHRLMKPYNCGDVDSGPSKRSSSMSRQAPPRSSVMPATTQNKLDATKSPLSEPNKQSTTSRQISLESTAVAKDVADGGKVDDGKPGSSPAKKTDNLAAGKDDRFKGYELHYWITTC